MEVRVLNIAGFPTTPGQKQNLLVLANALTVLEGFWIQAGGKPFRITSGFRSWQAHEHIYALKGISPAPKGSQHLQGNAADIYDPDRSLQVWLEGDGEKHMIDLDLYREAPDKELRVHLQTVPPKSHHRVFYA